MSEDTDKLAKALKAIERRLYAAEKGNRAIAIIHTWIEMYDQRFDTPGDLIRKIKELCNDVLTKQ
ncbi:MAG: hypothetical protein IKA32_02775 [Lentisphaeria bacterium]|nr:hypothetical protein [Lentisphaeria bacterium]